MKNKYELRIEAEGSLTLDTKLWINGCLAGNLTINNKDWKKFLEDHSTNINFSRTLNKKLKNKYRIRIIFKSITNNEDMIKLFINNNYAGILDIKKEDWDNFVSDHQAKVIESKIR